MLRPWTERVLARLRRNNPWYVPADSAPPARAGDGRPAGVNLCGYLRDESGWGAATRGYLRALRALPIPLAVMDLSDLTSNRSEDRSAGAADSEFPYDITLACVDAGQHFAMQDRVGAEFFDGRFNIGAWAWELPRFPENWLDRFAYYDEIWVGTSFIANALAPISPVPVVRIPPVLAARPEGSREAGRARLGLRRGEFAFLFAFDVHSHLARKNPAAVIDAFRRAFRPDEPVRLVLKSVNARSDPEGYAALRARAGDARVTFLDGYWPAQEIRDLMAASDAYASLHRSEGTGLTITDAMALGKPVIATGWSGNMDYMTVANSYPVRFELAEIRQGVGPYHAGGVWAEPSVEHAAELMREVVDDSGGARARGESARRDIAAFASEDAVAALVGERLALISGRRDFPAFRRELREFYASYRQLGGLVREAVGRVVPPDATVAVVSKGDESLLELGVRRAWHFPRTDEGLYCGYHPPDSVAAIAHLRSLRERGAGYLVVPGTAFWWFDHYTEFCRHLDDEHDRVFDGTSCVVFRLREPSAGDGDRHAAAVAGGACP